MVGAAIHICLHQPPDWSPIPVPNIQIIPSEDCTSPHSPCSPTMPSTGQTLINDLFNLQQGPLASRHHPDSPHRTWAPGVHLITCEEGQKLAAGPFHPEGQGDGGQLFDAVEAKLMRTSKGGETVSKPRLKRVGQHLEQSV